MSSGKSATAGRFHPSVRRTDSMRNETDPVGWKRCFPLQFARPSGLPSRSETAPRMPAGSWPRPTAARAPFPFPVPHGPADAPSHRESAVPSACRPVSCPSRAGSSIDTFSDTSKEISLDPPVFFLCFFSSRWLSFPIMIKNFCPAVNPFSVLVLFSGNLQGLIMPAGTDMMGERNPDSFADCAIAMRRAEKPVECLKNRKEPLLVIRA